MKLHKVESLEEYKRLADAGQLTPGDRLVFGRQIKVVRVDNTGATRQQRRALRRENMNMALVLDTSQTRSRKERRGLIVQSARGVS